MEEFFSLYTMSSRNTYVIIPRAWNLKRVTITNAPWLKKRKKKEKNPISLGYTIFRARCTRGRWRGPIFQRLGTGNINARNVVTNPRCATNPFSRPDKATGRNYQMKWFRMERRRNVRTREYVRMMAGMIVEFPRRYRTDRTLRFEGLSSWEGGEVTQNRADSGSNAKIMRPVNRKLLDIGDKISRARAIYLPCYRLF